MTSENSGAWRDAYAETAAETEELVREAGALARADAQAASEVFKTAQAEWDALRSVFNTYEKEKAAEAALKAKKSCPAGPFKFKNPKPGVSGKAGAKDIPSWAKGQRPYESESGKDFAKRLLDSKYGAGKYPTGPGSEFNQIKKYGDRSF